VSPATATFACTLNLGQPEARVDWFKGGKALVIDNKKFISSRDGNTVKLEVTDTTPDDASSYEVVAENKVGKATSKANLTVHSKNSLHV
jgi:hypothetical protein